MKSDWTRHRWLITFGLLFFFCSVRLAAQEPLKDEDAARRQEKKIEAKALKARCLQLQAALLRTEKELESVRADFTQAYLELKKLQTQTAALRLKAANVLANQADLEKAQTLRLLLKDMQELNAVHKRLHRELLTFSRYLESVLDVLDKDGSTELRKKLNSRLYLLLKTVQEAERLSNLGGRQPAKATLMASRVLAVNEKLGVVVLDIGRKQGARLGSLWTVQLKRKTAKLKIIEVAQSLSAATVIKGKLAWIVAGMPARRDLERPAKTEK